MNETAIQMTVRDVEIKTEVFCKKKLFLNISQNSPENTCVGVSFFLFCSFEDIGQSMFYAKLIKCR